MKFLVGFSKILMVVLLLSSCGSTPTSSDIFSKPPFASITDSIKRFPDKPELYLQRALLLSQANLHDLATPDYKKAWEIAQEEVTAMEYASNLILVNKTEEALGFLKQCKQKFPGNNEITRRLSELYAQTGQRREALAEYDTILANDSTNFLAWYEKGRLLCLLRDTAEAIASLRKSYMIQPTNYTGFELATIYSSQTNPDVVAICDDILRRDTTGNVPDALLLKGIYYSDIHQYPQALELFEQCIKLDWKFVHAHIEKGIVYFEMKDFNKALDAFKISATVDNTNADSYFWMGRTYEQLQMKEQAIESYERALAFKPDIVEAEQALKRLQ